MIKVLAIGDIGNYLVTLSKYVKKSKIHIINFAKDGAGKFTYDENYELFENYKVVDQVKKINEIKKNFDIYVEHQKENVEQREQKIVELKIVIILQKRQRRIVK